jgi:hypothetical protein
MHDLFGTRRGGADIVFFAGEGWARYAHVRQLFVQPADFDRPLTSASDCWPLSRVTIELQPSSRYKQQPSASLSSMGIEDFYLWMTIDNARE